MPLGAPRLHLQPSAGPLPPGCSRLSCTSGAARRKAGWAALAPWGEMPPCWDPSPRTSGPPASAGPSEAGRVEHRASWLNPAGRGRPGHGERERNQRRAASPRACKDTERERQVGSESTRKPKGRRRKTPLLETSAPAPPFERLYCCFIRKPTDFSIACNGQQWLSRVSGTALPPSYDPFTSLVHLILAGTLRMQEAAFYRVRPLRPSSVLPSTERQWFHLALAGIEPACRALNKFSLLSLPLSHEPLCNTSFQSKLYFGSFSISCTLQP